MLIFQHLHSAIYFYFICVSFVLVFLWNWCVDYGDDDDCGGADGDGEGIIWSHGSLISHSECVRSPVLFNQI